MRTASAFSPGTCESNQPASGGWGLGSGVWVGAYGPSSRWGLRSTASVYSRWGLRPFMSLGSREWGSPLFAPEGPLTTGALGIEELVKPCWSASPAPSSRAHTPTRVHTRTRKRTQTHSRTHHARPRPRTHTPARGGGARPNAHTHARARVRSHTHRHAHTCARTRRRRMPAHTHVQGAGAVQYSLVKPLRVRWSNLVESDGQTFSSPACAGPRCHSLSLSLSLSLCLSLSVYVFIKMKIERNTMQRGMLVKTNTSEWGVFV